MKYTKEIVEEITKAYKEGVTVEQLAETYEAPVRSIIAKLSSLGIYKKKEYLNKRGEIPIKKELYLEAIAKALNCPVDRLESLEKCNKSVLKLILGKLAPT